MCIKKIFSILFILLLGLQGCSSTKLVTGWADDNYSGEKLHKILVIGLVKDDVMRRHFEDEFVGNLASKGREAVASYIYMPRLQDYEKEDKLEAVVRKVGADAVLITTLKDVENRQKYVPPRVDYVSAVGRGYGYYGYYYQSMQPIYKPGYVRTDKVVQLETRVFSVQSKKVVWGGMTESFNPSSSSKVIDELAALVVSDMRKSDLIK